MFSERSKSTVMLAVRSVLFLNRLPQLAKLWKLFSSPVYHFTILLGSGEKPSPPTMQVCLLRRAKKAVTLEISDNATTAQAAQVLQSAARMRPGGSVTSSVLQPLYCDAVKPL